MGQVITPSLVSDCERDSNMILVDAYINDGNNDISLVTAAPIPAGSSLELIDGGSKIVATSADRLYVKSDTAASVDVHVRSPRNQHMGAIWASETKHRLPLPRLTNRPLLELAHRSTHCLMQ